MSGEPYEDLKERLNDAMKRKDPEKIRDAVDDIEVQVAPNKVPKDDKLI